MTSFVTMRYLDVSAAGQHMTRGCPTGSLTRTHNTTHETTQETTHHG